MLITAAANFSSLHIPLIWLTAELVPVPKSGLPSTKNNLRPVALMAIIMKTFEKVVLKHLSHENLIHKLQYAYIYISDRRVDDATIFLKM